MLNNLKHMHHQVLVLEGATVAAMDAFMQENAAEVLLPFQQHTLHKFIGLVCFKHVIMFVFK